MRKTVIIFCLSLLCTAALSQRQQGFYLELGGASTSVGLHYDTRFNEKTRWGGRIGIAYTYSSSEDFFDFGPQKTSGWSIPVAVNYLIGSKKHNLELGIGISYGMYSCKKQANGFEVEQPRNGAFGFVDIGYRYQSSKGLMVRMGMNPGVALGEYNEFGIKENGVSRAAVIYPYVSVGYNF